MPHWSDHSRTEIESQEEEYVTFSTSVKTIYNTSVPHTKLVPTGGEVNCSIILTEFKRFAVQKYAEKIKRREKRRRKEKNLVSIDWYVVFRFIHIPAKPNEDTSTTKVNNNQQKKKKFSLQQYKASIKLTNLLVSSTETRSEPDLISNFFPNSSKQLHTNWIETSKTVT